MTRESSAIAGSALFFVLAPVVVAGLVPWWITGWQLGRPLLWLPGILLIIAGLPGLIDSFRRFAVEGLGTPAPVAPTEHLIVSGLYRRVRNPMYVSILLLILGQAALFASEELVIYGLVVWFAFHFFVILYEEPALRRQFDGAYLTYTARVPRWLPLIKPAVLL